MTSPALSVILPTRNPHPGRLRATLEGLVAQSLPRGAWEFILVDNGSACAVNAMAHSEISRLQGNVVSEPVPGLTAARACGIRTARGEILVFVDDDNVLAPHYLITVAQQFAAAPCLGAAGGPVLPAWETTPPEWTREFWGLLALRERGSKIETARGSPAAPWPALAPVGAGLAIRRTFAASYVDAIERDPRRRALDRVGTSLASGGDNDLVFTALHAGADVGYFPALRVTHLIPAARLEPGYLARLNAGIQRTWVRVLALHGFQPWPPIARWTVAPRSARAWWRERAWRSAAHCIRWHGRAGRFAGQADIADAVYRSSPPGKS